MAGAWKINSGEIRQITFPNPNQLQKINLIQLSFNPDSSIFEKYLYKSGGGD